MYAAAIGEVDGVRLLSSETLAAATKEQANGPDQVMALLSRFSSGYVLPAEGNPMTGSKDLRSHRPRWFARLR